MFLVLLAFNVVDDVVDVVDVEEVEEVEDVEAVDVECKDLESAFLLL